METKKENQEELIPIALKIAEQTIGFDIKSCKFEDIGKGIGEILTKCLKKKVTVTGDGLTAPINCKIEN